MSNIIPGHSAPTAGFEVPLEMLSACHHRIERQCATLRRLVDHLATHGPDQQARDAAAGVMRYFDTAGRDHHADEEEDLFPALIESMAGSDPICLREITQGLANVLVVFHDQNASPRTTWTSNASSCRHLDHAGE